MIKPEWKRVAAIKAQSNGTLCAVWLAHDKVADIVHLYDCAKFSQELFAVMAEGLNARARWVPIAYCDDDKEMAKELLERGCGMAAEPIKDDPAVAEVTSRDILERMRTGRFKADERLGEWFEEYRTFFRSEAQVPVDSHPLMTATRLAVYYLPYARSLSSRSAEQKSYPEVAIV